jgi:anti-sigma regulatory factor (Ser/Thr protein kinase)
MPIRRRKTGIPVTDDVPWGTHFCFFYHTKEDLLDILVPYFKAGLENNEFCVWVTSDILPLDEAIAAMRRAIPDFSLYVYKGQIDIIPHDRWYLNNGFFDSERVLKAWRDKYNLATVKGYEGLRAAGDTAWLANKDWRDVCRYEQKANSVVGSYKILAMCSYCLQKCDPEEALDVLENHEFAIVKGAATWGRMKNYDQMSVETGLRKVDCKHLYNTHDQLSSDMPGGRKRFTGILNEIAGLKLEEEAIIKLNVGPPVLYELGLFAALKWYAEMFSSYTGINVIVRGGKSDSRQIKETEIAMFHIALEALTNVVKHARASHVIIDSESDAEIVRLRIADNGIGFDKSLQQGANTWGLLTLRERVIAINGQFHIESTPGSGTSVTVEAPL